MSKVGDEIKTKVTTKEYEANYDVIFRKDNKDNKEKSALDIDALYQKVEKDYNGN